MKLVRSAHYTSSRKTLNAAYAAMILKKRKGLKIKAGETGERT